MTEASAAPKKGPLVFLDYDQTELDRCYDQTNWAPNVEIVHALLEAGADVNFINERGCSALRLAVQSRSLATVEALVAAHANLDIRQPATGLTPLHHVIFMGFTEIASYLLAHGAAVDLQTLRGFSALHMAALHNRPDIAGSLISAGASLDLANQYGMTPRHVACQYGHVEVLRVLLAAGAQARG